MVHCLRGSRGADNHYWRYSQCRTEVCSSVRLFQIYRTVIFLAVIVCASPSAWAESADLELVLALDASGSVDMDEFSLQLHGIAAGFRDEVVNQAIRSGTKKRIAVNVLIWADHQMPKDSIGWQVIASRTDAERFARLVESWPRRQNGATGIGEGIAAAVRSINENGIDAPRRVIDVSGDGQETTPRDYVVLLPQALAMARGYDITINGLAISNEDPKLLSYYQSHVQSGSGSFTMGATDYAEFAAAMRRKLVREIVPQPNISGL